MKPGVLTAALLALTLTAIPAGPGPAAQTGRAEFTRAQYRWAMSWINGPLETLMAHDIIASISRADGKFQMIAGEAWQQLSFRQAGEILKNLSRARQITGHSPFFTVEQATTGTVFARVSSASITLLIPGAGYMEYLPDTRDRENTSY